MISKTSIITAVFSAISIAGLAATDLHAQQPPHWIVPTGFEVSVFAENVENAREMAISPQGTVFVGSLRAGKVHAVIDRNGDHKADRVVLIASGLQQPNGVAIRNGALYVATASKILRFDDIEQHLDSPPSPVVVRDSLPNSSAGHMWKFISFGPDDLLYMSVGAPCNVCLSPPMVSTILRMKPDGSNLEAAALGRPVDVLQMPDGSILISDDKGNRLLRVSYGGQKSSEVTINDTDVGAENLTSSQDGTVYFGSMTKGNIYRVAPGASRAEPWILASTAGLTRVLGVLADDKSNTLWVCQNSTGGRDGAPVVGQTALRSFDLKTGAAKGTYPFPPNSRVCNDIAVSTDGTAYVSESFGGRIHRLRPRANALEVWASDANLEVIDGLAILADGSVYANNFATGKLYRIPVNTDGSAGAIMPIETSMPLGRPDGLRAAGPRTLIQAEQEGRFTELTIDGNRAEVRVVQGGLTRASGVTIVGNSALVLVEFTKAVVVPYRAR